MAIKVTKDGTVTTVIDDNGKLTNSPVLALSPSSTARVIVKEQNPQGNIAGFISGGSTTDAPSMPKIDNIEKFLFSHIDASATEIGNLSATKTNHAGNSSLTHGFATGGPGAPAAGGSLRHGGSAPAGRIPPGRGGDVRGRLGGQRGGAQPARRCVP